MTDPLVRTIQVQCSIAHAFATFTGKVDLWWPASHRRFAASKLQLEAHVGGRFFERTASGQEALLGEVLRCDPPNAIRFSWHPGKIDLPTEVDVSFTQDGDQTSVKVVHSSANSGLADMWPERVAMFSNGWDTVLPAFANHAQSTI